MTQAFGTYFPPRDRSGPQYIDIEIHDGIRWVSLNDHHNFVLGSGTLERTAQQLRNHSVSSSMYDGDFIVHSTKSNITETIEIYVLGSDQIHVGDNIEHLQQAFMQPQYSIRRTFDQDVEIWRCWPADYVVQRGHVNIHNVRATMTFSVPRFPKVTREVFE